MAYTETEAMGATYRQEMSGWSTQQARGLPYNRPLQRTEHRVTRLAGQATRRSAGPLNG